MMMRWRERRMGKKAKRLAHECELLEFKCGRLLGERHELRQRIAMIEQERGEATRRVVWTS
jgi:hypothetical protein